MAIAKRRRKVPSEAFSPFPGSRRGRDEKSSEGRPAAGIRLKAFCVIFRPFPRVQEGKVRKMLKKFPRRSLFSAFPGSRRGKVGKVDEGTLGALNFTLLGVLDISRAIKKIKKWHRKKSEGTPLLIFKKTRKNAKKRVF